MTESLTATLSKPSAEVRTASDSERTFGFDLNGNDKSKRNFTDNHRLNEGPRDPFSQATDNNQPRPNGFDWKNQLPKFGYTLTSSLHAMAAITNIYNFLPKTLKKLLDVSAVRLSKGVTSIYYAFLAADAWREKRMFDFIARILDPLFVPWMNLEDIHLARGLSAGLTQIDNSQKDRVGKHQSRSESLQANVLGFLEMLKENIQRGPAKLIRTFFGMENDEGHPMAFSGYLIMLGSLIGVAFGANQRNIWNKIGGVVRNIGGFIGDMTMMMHPDPDNKKSGFFYCINAVIDALQRFLPKEIIDTVNHFNMILNNLGTYYFGKLSQKQSDGTFKSYKDRENTTAVKHG